MSVMCCCCCCCGPSFLFSSFHICSLLVPYPRDTYWLAGGHFGGVLFGCGHDRRPQGGRMTRWAREQTGCHATGVRSFFSARETGYGQAMTTNGYRLRFLFAAFGYTE